MLIITLAGHRSEGKRKPLGDGDFARSCNPCYQTLDSFETKSEPYETGLGTSSNRETDRPQPPALMEGHGRAKQAC
jgi:hypothetical protein